jgi:hypothetical protein
MNSIINDSRKIRIEPNPFKSIKQKFRMKTQKLNQSGVPVVSTSGTPVMTEIEPDNLYRVPGTSKRVAPRRTAYGVETGLTHLVSNPYKDLPSYTTEWEVVLKGKEKVLLQHVLEYELGYPFDYLTARIPDAAVASDKENKKFFETLESKPKLDGNVTFLNLSNPIHRINYYTLLAHPAVANTWEELEDGGNSAAEWYIVDEEAKQQREVSNASIAVEGGAALKELKDSNSDAIIQMAKALELNDASDRNINKDKAFNMLYAYYNKGRKEFDQFMEVYRLWKDAVVGRPKFIAMAELYDYIRAGLVSYKNGRYVWYKVVPGEPAETFTYNGKMEFITQFILDPAMADHVEALQEEYERKSK